MAKIVMPKGLKGFQKGHKFYGDLSKPNYFKNGNHPKTEFKKGNKKSPDAYSFERNEKHPMWKGDKVGYYALHTWVKRWKGKPEYCENCGVEGKMLKRFWSIDWANIDHRYRRVLEDYIGLCKSCHKKYDMKNNLTRKKYESK